MGMDDGVPKEKAAQQSLEISSAGHEYRITLVRVTSDERVGLAIQNLEGRCQVHTVKAEGIAHRWNEENPTIQITAGDYIKAVNGLTEYEEMRKVFLEQPTLHLTLSKN